MKAYCTDMLLSLGYKLLLFAIKINMDTLDYYIACYFFGYFLLLLVFAGVSCDGWRGFPIWDEVVVSIGTVLGRAPFAAFLAFLFSASSFDRLLYSALAGSKIVSGIVDQSPAGFLIWISGHFLFLMHTRVMRSL